MQNFNTNQTRHLYVAKYIDNSVDGNLEIALKKCATGELFFLYRNADGLLTRSDTFDPKKIFSLKKTTAAEMDLPILAHKVSIDTTAVAVGSGLIGKAISCMVTVHQMFDYDESNALTYTATVVGNSTNTANQTTLTKYIAVELAKVLPAHLVKIYCGATEVTKGTAVSDIASSPTAIYLIPKVQKYVRGKLAAETATLSVAFRLHDGEDTVWGTDAVDTVANFNTADTQSLTPTVVPGVNVLADLEYFSLGERGDYYRNMLYPCNFETTYAIDLSKTYDVVTVEFYWNGDAENVQKSPRTLQVACEISDGNSIAADLYDAIDAAMAGASS